MRVAFVLDSPSYRAVDEGRAVTSYTERYLSTLTQHRPKYFALLDSPPPKSATAKETMTATRERWEALEPKLIADGYTHIIGFGKFASWHITGYTYDAAWGMPQTINGTKRWGFVDLEYVLEKKGVLIPALKVLLGRLDETNQDPFAAARIHTEVESCAEQFRTAAPRAVALDIENNPSTNQIMALGLAWRQGPRSIAISVPWDEYESGKYGLVMPLLSYANGVYIKERILEILANPSIVKIGHNINHDVTALEKRGIAVNSTTDTMAMHHVLYPDAPHSLGFVAAHYCATPPWKKDFHASTEEKHVDAFVKRRWQDLAQYNARDCLATLWICENIQEDIEALPQGAQTLKNTLDAFDTARRMSRAGIMWDQKAADAHRERLGKVQAATLAFIHKHAQDHVPNMNPNSVAQLRKYFFGAQQVEPLKYTGKGAPSLDSEVLAMFQANPNPAVSHVAKAIIEYREAGKLMGSYLENAEECVERDGRVHPDVRPYGAKTGRWSIKDPAIQTIPEKMRDLYRAPEGSYLIYPDYSQLELRIAAMLAGDIPMLDTFAKGIRIHTQNTKDVFQAAYREGDKAQERQGKAVVFALNYGGAASTIQRNLMSQGYNVTLEFCENLVAGWFTAHPALKLYFEDTYKRISKDLFFELPISKRRLTWWRKPRRQETANWPIQATGADIVDRALRGIKRSIDWEHTKLIGQIHDAYLIQTTDVLGTCEILNREMVYTHICVVNGKEYPLTYQIGFNISNRGGHWACTTEYKTIDAVRKAAAEGKFS